MATDFREFRAVYSLQFFSLCLLAEKRFVLKTVCSTYFFCYHWLRNNREERIPQLRNDGSLDITRYPIPSKNHRNTCCKVYRIPAPWILPTVLHFNLWDTPKLMANLESFFFCKIYFTKRLPNRHLTNIYDINTFSRLFFLFSLLFDI